MNNKSFFGGVIISQEADSVARELIQELHIPKLYNLAFLLQTNQCFDDHQAIRLWTQNLIDNEQIDFDELLTQARLKLINLLT